MNRRKLAHIFSMIFAFSYTYSIQAQSSSGGNLEINEEGIVYIYDTHHFDEGSPFISPGMIATERTGAKGFLAFEKGSSWVGANAEGFVDGYVQVQHDESFIFPIGHQDTYRPIAISGGKETSAAYYKTAPKLPFTKLLHANNYQVSKKEHWDIEGHSSTRITLSWGKGSEVQQLMQGNLENLSILGYKNGRWHIVPSKILETIPTPLILDSAEKNTQSTLQTGAIRTVDPIIPSDFVFFTIGGIKGNPSNANLDKNEFIKVFPNPVVKNVYVDLEKTGVKEGQVIIYNVYGQAVAERTVNLQTKGILEFDASDFVSGMYEVQIKSKERDLSKKFMVGRK